MLNRLPGRALLPWGGGIGDAVDLSAQAVINHAALYFFEVIDPRFYVQGRGSFCRKRCFAAVRSFQNRLPGVELLLVVGRPPREGYLVLMV